jgi:hypothetical protein
MSKSILSFATNVTKKHDSTHFENRISFSSLTQLKPHVNVKIFCQNL